MANTEDGPTVTAESQENGGDSIATNVDDDDDDDCKKKIDTLFACILKKLETLGDDKRVNEIEKALVTNITSDLNIVKALLVAEFCTEKYIKDHVHGKVDSIRKEVDGLINYLKEKEEQNKNNRKIDEEKKMKEAGVEDEKRRKFIKTSEWWYSIAKKTEKIKTLVSQFGTLPDDEDDGVGGGTSSSSSSTSKKKKLAETLYDTTECHYMCIEENLLISPMIVNSLKKSYHHLPPELRLCLLSLSAFPENFIIKKRPLIYWWMAEGFVAATSKLSAEEVGEQNFTQLIQLGLIQPWYEVGNNNKSTQFFPHVQGCRVHPWIRRMLVSIAMEAQLFEFYGINNKVQHEHEPHPRSARVCLYDDDVEGVEHIAIWKAKKLKYDKFRERLKWPKAQALLEKNKKEQLHEDLSKMPKDVNEVCDRQKKLSSTFDKATKRLAQLNDLVFDVSHERMKDWIQHDALNQRLNNLMTTILQMKQKDGDEMQNADIIINELHVEQMEQLNDVEGLHEHVLVQVNYLDRLLAPDVYERRNNCETLQNSERLFRHNDLTNQFPFPIKKRTTRSDEKRTSDGSNDDDVHHAEKLLAIINVSQSYLDMEPELFGKMKRLRTLHLGRWRDCLPVPHIEVENTKIFEALFRVAKHLKYLSLRGISRITELPKTISNCTNLQILDLKACYNLEKLPSQISSLSKLTHFDVSECYLLPNTNLWSLVESLEFLQTLKGLRVDESSQNSLQNLMSSGSLRKLSIILTTTTLHIDFSNTFRNLRVLTITWRTQNLLPQQPDKSDGGSGTENPPPQQPEKSDGGASTENPPPQQPEKSEDSGAASTENPQQPKSGKGNGGASTENVQQPKPGKSDGGASTEKPQKERSDEVKGIEDLTQLKKLDLRCYPYKAWPHWLKKHTSLETLYITGGNIEEFPKDDDLVLPKLKVLRLKYLSQFKLGQDFSKSQLKETKFPSLTDYLYIKSQNP